MLKKQKKRSCTKQYPGQSWKTPSVQTLWSSQAFGTGWGFLPPGPREPHGDPWLPGPQPWWVGGQDRSLTFLGLAAEVELGLLRRHDEQQDGHKDGHGGIGGVPGQGKHIGLARLGCSDSHATNLFCVWILLCEEAGSSEKENWYSRTSLVV